MKWKCVSKAIVHQPVAQFYDGFVEAFKICGRDKPSLEDSANLSDFDIIGSQVRQHLDGLNPSSLSRSRGQCRG
jgi:hypothetical protein